MVDMRGVVSGDGINRMGTLESVDLVDRLKMCWFFHEYEKWVDTKKGNTVYLDNRVGGTFIEQERRCRVCGKVQMRNEQC